MDRRSYWGVAYFFVLKLAVTLRRCHKIVGNSLIERSSGVGTRVTQLRQPQLTQVAEITELNCYNRYFFQERYATPGSLPESAA
jgi:hypothetical protein